MAKYGGTYTCGHEGNVQIYGPTKNREWIRERHFDRLCEECRKKEIAAENVRAMQQAKEMKLPDLTGSEKQVAWANSIRIRMIGDLEDLLDKLDDLVEKHKEKASKEEMDFAESIRAAIHRILAYVAMTEQSSRWFIDHRNDKWSFFEVEDYVKKHLPSDDELVPELGESVQEADVLLKPENQTKDGYAEIKQEDAQLVALYAKDDDFRDVVRECGLKWDSERRAWTRKLGVTSGTMEDRMAELGSRLLAAGFAVLCSNEKARDMIATGEYEPTHTRWVTCPEDREDVFRIRSERDEGLIQIFRKFAKWHDGAWETTAQRVNDVLELMRLHGFRATPDAQALIDRQEALCIQAQIVRPVVTEHETRDKTADILNSSDDVLPDLVDKVDP